MGASGETMHLENYPPVKALEIGYRGSRYLVIKELGLQNHHYKYGH